MPSLPVFPSRLLLPEKRPQNILPLVFVIFLSSADKMTKQKQLGRHKGGRELLAAVGFCDELRAEAGQRDTGSTDRMARRAESPSEKAVAAAAANGGQVHRLMSGQGG